MKLEFACARIWRCEDLGRVMHDYQERSLVHEIWPVNIVSLYVLADDEFSVFSYVASTCFSNDFDSDSR